MLCASLSSLDTSTLGNPRFLTTDLFIRPPAPGTGLCAAFHYRLRMCELPFVRVCLQDRLPEGDSMLTGITSIPSIELVTSGSASNGGGRVLPYNSMGFVKSMDCCQTQAVALSVTLIRISHYQRLLVCSEGET